MSNSRRGGAMLGLVGLLIVVALILYLMVGSPGGGGGGNSGSGNSGGGAGYLGQMAKTKNSAEKLSIDHEAGQIATLVAQYRAEHNTLPKSIADLEAGSTIENDKWGKPLTLEFEGETMKLTSAGPDGEFGTEDDIHASARIPF